MAKNVKQEEILNRNQSITIKDLAKIAGVSHTTVSRALNGSELVKESTRKKIAELAKQLGYTPNINARSLVTNRSYVLGIFFTNLETGTSTSFLTEVIEQTQRMLSSRYSISINSIDKAIRDIEQYSLSVSNYDGVIIISQSKSDDQFIAEVIDSGVPLVVLNRRIANKDVNNYAINDYLGSKSVTEMAIRMGHRHFALIQGIESFESANQRTAGFMDALREAGLNPDEAIIGQGDYKPRSGNIAMRQILSSGKVPTCVICENDDMAVGALDACVELGYRVPDDISVIGFDDMSYSKYLMPPLTTVRKPTSTIVKKGVSKLMGLLEQRGKKENESVDREDISSEIIVRSSVKKIN